MADVSGPTNPLIITSKRESVRQDRALEKRYPLDLMQHDETGPSTKTLVWTHIATLIIGYILGVMLG